MNTEAIYTVYIYIIGKWSLLQGNLSTTSVQREDPARMLRAVHPSRLIQQGQSQLNSSEVWLQLELVASEGLYNQTASKIPSTGAIKAAKSRLIELFWDLSTITISVVLENDLK